MTSSISTQGHGLLQLRLPHQRKPAPRIAGVATAVTDTSYSQQELLDLFQIADPKVRAVFLNSAIARRYLTLPARGDDGAFAKEPQGALLQKHKRLAVDMAARAVRACLADAGLAISGLDFLCCVTSTGFLTPGLSALVIRELGIDPGCHRVDIVGMGCNAGLNALNAVAHWSRPTPANARSWSARKRAPPPMSWTLRCGPPSSTVCSATARRPSSW